MQYAAGSCTGRALTAAIDLAPRQFAAGIADRAQRCPTVGEAAAGCRRGRKRGSARPYCTGVSLKRQEYCLLNTSISRVFPFPVRSTERFLLPIGTDSVVSSEPS